MYFNTVSTADFNPRAPCGARPSRPSGASRRCGFQSTRPVRGATQRDRRQRLHEQISIHAPRAGRDASSIACLTIHKDFNPRAPCGARQGRVVLEESGRISIHAPRAGRDQATNQYYRQPDSFQSTRPVRGATGYTGYYGVPTLISIHAPRAGRDVLLSILPTPVTMISIHAPRAGRDQDSVIMRSERLYFNPRAPCGARLISIGLFLPTLAFQSTRPVRGATEHRNNQYTHLQFQSTRPVRGATYYHP